MQCPNDWICLHCKKPGHRQADCPEELNTSNSSSEEESDANDADTEDTEVSPAHAHDALQPSNSGDVLSIIHAKDKAQSVNNHLQDKIQCDQEIVNGGENDEKKKPKHKKKKKNTEPGGNIEQYFKGQTVNTNTPAAKKKNGKRNASTPTEDKHKEAVPIQKTKT
ncbi:ZCCHC9 [Mytilus edulis]|uniref:ZCCHC9 n=1 Tax=Mytilus edulis TaxID=6550 RepID=A0A8S3RZM4_MYTED|nr:ZCCHC9 [Mytilus edulis]